MVDNFEHNFDVPLKKEILIIIMMFEITLCIASIIISQKYTGHKGWVGYKDYKGWLDDYKGWATVSTC